MNNPSHEFAGDVGSLPASEYHAIVAPALEVCAELAAARNDPDLYNDMASMLVLRVLVQALGECFLEEHATASASLRKVLAAAADGACGMVLKRGELSAAQLGECLWALQTATGQLTDAHVFDQDQKLIHAAWRHLSAGNRKDAIGQLTLAAGGMATAIDTWERERDGGSMA